jgi:hypothetical protein
MVSSFSIDSGASQSWRGVPVVLASAEHEFAFGAPVWDELWQKPVSVETMLASIRRLVALPS